jgi:hypothetical protein
MLYWYGSGPGKPGRGGKKHKGRLSSPYGSLLRQPLMRIHMLPFYCRLLSAIDNYPGNLIGTCAGAGSGVFAVTSMLWIAA